MNQSEIGWLGEQTGLVLRAAVEHHSQTVCDLVNTVGREHGYNGLLGLCCGIAAAIRLMILPDWTPGDGTLTGDVVMPVLTGPQAGRAEVRWVGQFVAACANGDHPTARALFDSALHDMDTATGNVMTLIAVAGHIGRNTTPGGV